MYRINLSDRFVNGLTLTFCTLLIGGLPVALPAQGEGAIQGNRDPSQIPAEGEVGVVFKQPNTDEVSNPSDRPRGGGSRPVCRSQPAFDHRNLQLPCTELRLTALVPLLPSVSISGQTQASAWGQTLQARPSFWFYVPYPPGSIQGADFELADTEGTLIFQEPRLSLAQATGIMRYTPALSQPLTVGKTYRWHLRLRFDPDYPSADAYVTGRVKRTVASPELAGQLANASTPLQTARALANAGIWYDTLAALAQVYPFQPDAWINLLESVGLEQIADQKIVEFTPKTSMLKQDDN